VSPPTLRHRGPRPRGPRRAWLILPVLLAGFAVAQPGHFRLALLQPARDLLFFQREVQPIGGGGAMERRGPRPDSTGVLRAAPDAPHDVDLAFDLWRPTVTPAPAVLLAHGSSPRGRRLGFNVLLADHLRTAGWLVITPDARGFGGSGKPADRRAPGAWRVAGDLERLVAWTRTHAAGNGTVVAVGHSLGGSQLFEAFADGTDLAALALIGPARYEEPGAPTVWERIRFASDRRLGRPIPAPVLVELTRRQDLLRAPAAGLAGTPVLLMDGEREGDRLIGLLDAVAARLGPDVRRVTVPGSHHYCGAYQLPFLDRPVFVRPAVFEACADSLLRFLDGFAAR
jgi:pimeloyl-ACP methyl ester carboxylesterase